MTKAVITKDDDKRQAIASIVKKSFAKGTELRKELDLIVHWTSLLQTTRKLQSASYKKQKHSIRASTRTSCSPSKQTWLTQSTRISPRLSSPTLLVTTNTLPLFLKSSTATLRSKNEFLWKTLSSQQWQRSWTGEHEVIDNVVYNLLLKVLMNSIPKFCQKSRKNFSADTSLPSDNGVEFKMYMNEEVGRLKEKVKNLWKKRSFQTKRWQNPQRRSMTSWKNIQPSPLTRSW